MIYNSRLQRIQTVKQLVNLKQHSMKTLGEIKVQTLADFYERNSSPNILYIVQNGEFKTFIHDFYLTCLTYNGKE